MIVNTIDAKTSSLKLMAASAEPCSTLAIALITSTGKIEMALDFEFSIEHIL